MGGGLQPTSSSQRRLDGELGLDEAVRVLGQPSAFALGDQVLPGGQCLLAQRIVRGDRRCSARPRRRGSTGVRCVHCLQHSRELVLHALGMVHPFRRKLVLELVHHHVLRRPDGASTPLRRRHCLPLSLHHPVRPLRLPLSRRRQRAGVEGGQRADQRAREAAREHGSGKEGVACVEGGAESGSQVPGVQTSEIGIDDAMIVRYDSRLPLRLTRGILYLR